MDTVRHLTKALKNGPPNMHWREANERWHKFRIARGWTPNAPLLTPPDGNMKLSKDPENMTYGLALAPANASSGHNVCRHATPECMAGCVAYSGNGLYPKIGRARALKVEWLHHDAQAFVTLLEHEIGNIPADTHIRLNTFSDIPWERVAPWIVERGNFYDYTKWPDREASGDYSLTYSASERTSDEAACDMLERMNVAVVFDTPRTKALPDEWLGHAVIDGDTSDARWLDPRPCIVGLRAKGRMRNGTWRMVRKVYDQEKG